MAENKSPIAIDSNPHIDPCLILLNNMVNVDTSIDGDLSFCITLILQGTIISGKLISENVYFSRVTKTISSRLQSKIIDDLFDEYRAIFAGNGFETLFLHLKNVLINSPDTF